MATELGLPETMHIESEAETAPPPPAERPMSARERAMAAIIQHAEEERGKEIAQGAEYDRIAASRGEGLPPATFDEPEEAAEEVEAHAPVQPTEPAPVPPAPPAPEPVHHTPLRTINLQGQLIQVTEAQFEQLAHMGAVAGMALSQAPVAPPAPAAPSFEEVARKLVQNFQFGSPEEATSALIDYTHSLQRAGQQADPNLIAQQAAAQAMAQIQAQRDTEVIRAEYPQIFADPDVQHLAHVKVDAIKRSDAAKGVRRSDIEVYREAGNQVYDLMKLPRPGSDIPSAAPQAAQQAQPRAEVLERKRAAPRNPASVDRRAVTPEAPRAPTASEIISAMAKSRHQQVPTRI